MSALKRKKEKTCQHAPMKWIQNPHEMRFLPNSREFGTIRLAEMSVSLWRKCFFLKTVVFTSPVSGPPGCLWHCVSRIRELLWTCPCTEILSVPRRGLCLQLVTSSPHSLRGNNWRDLGYLCYRSCEKVLFSEIWWAFPEKILLVQRFFQRFWHNNILWEGPLQRHPRLWWIDFTGFVHM